MYLPQARGQQQRDVYYDYSGTITTGGTAQLALPQSKSRTHLTIQNLSSGILMIQFGMPRFTATLTSGAVSAVSITDPGFGFGFVPNIHFYGGGNANDPQQTIGATMPEWPSVFSPARARAVLTAGAITSILLDSGGSGYTAAPYVFVQPDRRDSTGVGTASATAGIMLGASGGSYYLNGTACSCDAISIWGATTGQAFTIKWML